MRFVIVSLILLLSGCTAMLIGGGNGGTTGQDERNSAEIAADGAMTAAVRDRLAADPILGRYRLGIGTRDGRVTLQGAVDTYAARSRAAALARQVDGVVSVNNRIRVVADD